MLNLFKVEWLALIKMKAVKWSFVGMLILSIALNLQYLTDNAPAFEGLFNGLMVVNLLSVAVGGLALNNDFSQNSIRNKIVIGYSRTTIVLTKTLIIALYYFLLALTAFIPALIIHCGMLEAKDVVWEAVNKGFILTGLNIINNVGLTMLLGLSARSVIGAVLPVFLAEAIPVSGMLISEVLSVSDSAKKLYDIVIAIPNIEVMMLSPYVIPANIDISLLITAVFSGVCLLLSLYVFNKAELN